MPSYGRMPARARRACLLAAVALALVLPAAAFEIAPETPGVGDAIAFSVSDPRGYGFSWDFGDGSSGTGNPVTHAYTAPGTYTVSLAYSRKGMEPALVRETRRIVLAESPTPQAAVTRTWTAPPQLRPAVRPAPAGPDRPPGDDIFPWALLALIPPLGYAAWKARVRARAREHCPDVSPSVRFDGGIGMEDPPPDCLEIRVSFSGGVQDRGRRGK